MSLQDVILQDAALQDGAIQEPVAAEEIRQFLESEGFEDGTVQYFGTQNDILIRMPPQEGLDQSSLGDRILAALRADNPSVEMRQSSFVGPAVGGELTEDGGLALLTALIVVMFYILFRFTKQFAVGAVTALAHDVVMKEIRQRQEQHPLFQLQIVVSPDIPLHVIAATQAPLVAFTSRRRNFSSKFVHSL